MTRRSHARIAPLLATASALVAIACTDSGTSPDPNAIRPNFFVSTDPSIEAGKIKICKVGNVDGTFTISVVSGSPSYSSPVTVVQGTCQVVVVDGTGTGSSVTIHETSAGFVSATFDGGQTYNDNSTVLLVNSIHGHTVTYTNRVDVVTGCTLTLGYWKNHANAWPVSSLTLGTVVYTQAQLLSIFNTPVKGNGLISLAHQLIAAKLNVAAGAGPAPSAIASADALIGGLVVPPVGSGFLAPSATSSLTSALDDFNNGLSGPRHCD